MNDVTRILNAIEQGDPQATEELLPLVYEELRLLAAQKLSRELPGLTLQATAMLFVTTSWTFVNENSSLWLGVRCKKQA